jgi:hypothetical protein
LVSGVDADDVDRFVRAIFGAAPQDAFVEVRFRRSTGMGQSFRRADAFNEIVSEVAAHARQRDVFVGVIPRRWRRGGRRDLVRDAALVWADCDGSRSVAALQRFEPAPSMVVASGTGSNCHAYWLLAEPIPLDVVESTNRQLARALEADVGSWDAARILRPAGTTNWKTEPPAAVRTVTFGCAARVDLPELRSGLPDVTEPPARSAPRARALRSPRSDPLLEIAPREYVERLSGRVVGRDRKMLCPFHDDHAPSLHVFDEPARGWFCFGCGRGGSIYDFAGLLWGRGVRGAEFLRLRRDLQAVFSCEVSRTDRDVVKTSELVRSVESRPGHQHGVL